MAKDFENKIKAKTYQETVAEAAGIKQTGQSEPGEAEKKARADAMQTQGRKGCKLNRINMAFTPENYEFIRTMAKLEGKSMTEFANSVIEAYRTERPELWERTKELMKEWERV